jgi:hypothetical protein
VNPAYVLARVPVTVRYADVSATFRNVSHYVEAGAVEAAAAVFRDVLDLSSAFARPGHIACFELATFDVAVCVHEAELDHPAESTELVFGHDIADEAILDPDGRKVRLLHVEGSADRNVGAHGFEFLNVTLYSSRVEETIAFYREGLGLVADYEQAGHLCAMGHVAVHDASEGPAGSARLYFLADDATTYADRAHRAGVAGVVRPDGYGNPAWHANLTQAFSIVVLTRGKQSG